MCEEIRSLRYLHRALRLECTILRRLVHFIPQIILICYWLLVFGGLGYHGTSLTWMMGLVYFLDGYEGESRVHYSKCIARGCLGNGEVGTKVDSFTWCWWRLLCADGCLYYIVLLVNVNTHI